MMGEKEKVIAHGNVARQINKNLRRERIFNIAKNQIAKKGLEAFTIAELAQEAGVSTPTIHNLFGKKSDIVKELVSNLIELMKVATVNPPIEPIENAKFIIDNLVASIEKDKDFFRAALMSMEQLRLLDPKIPNGLFQRAQQVAAPRKEWYETGLLLGNIEPRTIMKEVHDKGSGRNKGYSYHTRIASFCRLRPNARRVGGRADQKCRRYYYWQNQHT